VQLRAHCATLCPSGPKSEQHTAPKVVSKEFGRRTLQCVRTSVARAGVCRPHSVSRGVARRADTLRSSVDPASGRVTVVRQRGGRRLVTTNADIQI